MKILLINPPQVYNKGETPFLVFPLGLGYLAAVLRKNKFNIEILDCLGGGFHIKTKYLSNKYIIGLPFDKIRKKIQTSKPQVVMLSCYFSVQYHIIFHIANIIKSINKNIKVIVGGNPVSAKPKEFLKNANIDFAVIGEGELPLLNLLNSLINKANMHKINGLGFKKNKKIIINKKLNLVQKLDKLPFPAWDLFPIEKYLSSRYKHTMIAPNCRVAEVITSRGCPYSCTYCASQIVSGNRWRTRSISNVISEISTLKSKYNVREIHFLDDNLLYNRKRFEQLCKELINSRLNIKWTMPNGIQTNNLDEKLLVLMKKAGCYAIFLPIESTNQKIIKKHTNKKISLSHSKNIVKKAQELGLYLVGFFLIGFFEETKKDINNTIKFATDLGLDEAYFSIVTPLPGTRYYEEHSKSIDNYNYLSPKNANIDTKYLRRKEIEKIRDYAYMYFELHKLFSRPFSYLNFNQIKRIMRYLKYFLCN